MMPVKLDITDAPSPNFDERALPISLIILHYTGMQSGQAALERMRDPDAKVSAHYMVEETGQILRLVAEADRAWHAGVSQWRGMSDINSASIGIEIVNGGHDYGLPDFPDRQINAVIALCKDIMQRQDIAAANVIGHSDIAPARKDDPGEKFPWSGLAASGIGVWPEKIVEDRRVLFEPGQRDRGVAIAQSGLANIGYGAQVTGVMDEVTVQVLTAFQRHFRPDKIDGVLDMQTLSIIKGLTDQTS